MNKETLEKLSFLNKMAKVCPDKVKVNCIYAMKHYILSYIYNNSSDKITDIKYMVKDGQRLVQLCIDDFIFHVPFKDIPQIKWNEKNEIKYITFTRDYTYNEELTLKYFNDIFDIFYDLGGFTKSKKENNKLMYWFVTEEFKKIYNSSDVVLKDNVSNKSGCPLVSRSHSLIVDGRSVSKATFYKYLITAIQNRERKK